MKARASASRCHLAAEEVHAAGELGAQLGIESRRQVGDDRFGLTGGQEPERRVVLEAGRQPLPPGDRVDLGERHVVDQDAALGRAVQAAQQLDQGRLPGPAVADERDRAAGAEVQVDPGQRRPTGGRRLGRRGTVVRRLLSGRIAEPDALEPDPVDQPLRRPSDGRCPGVLVGVVAEPQVAVEGGERVDDDVGVVGDTGTGGGDLGTDEQQQGGVTDAGLTGPGAGEQPQPGQDVRRPRRPARRAP